MASLVTVEPVDGGTWWRATISNGRGNIGVVSLSIIQSLVRREVMGRLDGEQDERAAQQIQSRLLPSSLPEAPGIDLAGHYMPFRLVSGDYYDVMRLSDRHLLIAMADVSGKGPAAALLTANLQALLHFSQLREQPPVGWFESAAFACEEVAVPAGTTVLFYTDGLSERPNAAFDQYGFDRIRDTLRAAGALPAREVLHALLADVDRFAGRATPEDDTALLVLRSL